MLARQITFLAPPKQANSHSSVPLIDFYPPCFDKDTNPFSRNSRVFTSIQIARGWRGPPAPFGDPERARNSFIYRFYAKSLANSFIYRFYENHPGVYLFTLCVLRASVARLLNPFCFPRASRLHFQGASVESGITATHASTQNTSRRNGPDIASRVAARPGGNRVDDHGHRRYRDGRPFAGQR